MYIDADIIIKAASLMGALGGAERDQGKVCTCRMMPLPISYGC